MLRSASGLAFSFFLHYNTLHVIFFHDGVVEEEVPRMVVRDLETLRQMLLAERECLLEHINHDEYHAISSENFGYGNHMADDATQAFEQGKDASIRYRMERLLAEVNDALARIEAGTYGICERCGAEIDWARLEAKPYARYCIQCQERQELGPPRSMP